MSLIQHLLLVYSIELNISNLLIKIDNNNDLKNQEQIDSLFLVCII